MAKNSKADMSCARVKKYTSSDVSKAERHNERKNETYENMNVIAERKEHSLKYWGTGSDLGDKITVMY